MVKIGIIGCGAMGTELASAIIKISGLKLVAVTDNVPEKAQGLRRKVSAKIKVMDLDGLCNAVDLIVECAHPQVVPEVLNAALKFRKDVMIMSVGGALLNWRCVEKLTENGCNVYLPTGAIAGIDAITAAKLGGIQSAMICTRKPAKSFTGVKYLHDRGIDPAGFTAPQVVFRGNVLQAVKQFPVNINVAATLALAGIGPRKTRVQIIADPAIARNIHEITVTGKCGTIKTITENVPSPNNPKTSWLAILSAIAALNQIAGNLHLGT